MISLPLVHYVLMGALRDKLVITLMLVIALGASLAVFLGSTAIIEPLKFSLVFAAGGLRIAGVIGLVLFCIFHMRRSFDNKDIEFILSRPLSRTSFILSHSLAFSILAAVLALAICLAVILLSLGRSGPDYGLWYLSLIMEYLIIVNASLFFSMVVSTASGGVMAVFGLYVLARIIGDLLGDARTFVSATTYVLKPVMSLVSMIIPRLDLMAQTTWLVYPEAPANIGYGFILIEGFVYSGLLVCAALIDLRKRQF